MLLLLPKLPVYLIPGAVQDNLAGAWMPLAAHLVGRKMCHTRIFKCTSDINSEGATQKTEEAAELSKEWGQNLVAFGP